MLTSCVHLSLVLKYPPPMGVISLLHILHIIADDLAMTDLFDTMIRTPMIVLRLMNQFGTIGHVDRFGS